MYGKSKSKEFLECQGKPPFGTENFMFSKEKAISLWTTDGYFRGDFKTKKQIIQQLKISKEIIDLYVVFQFNISKKNRELFRIIYGEYNSDIYMILYLDIIHL